MSSQLVADQYWVLELGKMVGAQVMEGDAVGDNAELESYRAEAGGYIRQ